MIIKSLVIMADTFPNIPSDALFDAYHTKNIVEEGHERALGFQAILRELRPQLDSDEMNNLMAEATKELDDTTGHMGMEIVVTGNVDIRAIDPRGIDIDNQDFDVDAVREASHYVEESVFESMGYIIEPQYDDIKIFHIAKGGLATLISTTKYGDLYMSDRVYIPIDGTAFVQPVDNPTESSQKVLEYYADDLLQEVDVAILNSESHTDALRLLGAVELSDYKQLIEDESIAQALNAYIMKTLGIGGVGLYQLSGVDHLDIKLDEDTYSKAYLDPTHILTGSIDGIVIDEENMRFCLQACLPFSDNTTREVIYPFSEEFTISAQPTLRIL
jgi:hypothetical protein